jgi:DNA-binding XRE family transcriptional regulator
VSAKKKAVTPAASAGSAGSEPTSPGRAVPWREVKAKARAADPDWDSPKRVALRAQAREQILAAVNGAQLADLRKQAGLTQAQLAAATGLTQARISQIEHGTDVSLDTLRAYVTGLGGQVEIVARLGTTTLNIA